MAKRTKKQNTLTDREVYDSLVFQGSGVVSGPEDTGILEIATNNSTFSVIINHSNAEYLISQLDDFLRGRAPHFARDKN
jgi:hypothetical protein